MTGVEAQVVADTLERGVELREVVVKSKKEKYSKKNNPAVDFVNRLRGHAPDNDPLRNEHYNFRRYGRVTLAICPFDTTKMAKEGSRWNFLREHVIASPLSDTVMLPISVKERSSTVIYEDRKRREIIDAVKRNGMDEFVDQAGTEMYLEDVMRDIDIFQNDINLFQNRFVSPVGRIAPDFYRFYLTDTIASPDGNGRWIELSFMPMVNTTFGFTGRLYVAEGDTTMFVRKVKMGVPANINLNYVDRFEVDIEFERAPDGSRLKTLDDFRAELKLLPSLPGIYARRLARYTDHSFEEPSQDSKDILAQTEGEIVTLPDAEAAGVEEHWLSLREPEMESAESRVPQLMARLRGVPVYKYGEKALRILSSGYVATSRRPRASKFDIGPIYTFISGNDLEGLRLKVGGMTMPPLSDRLFAGGYVAYGTKDRRMKYNGWVEYSLIGKTKYASEFPVRSFRVEYFDDVSYISRTLLYTEDDNMFMSLSRSPQRMILYERKASARFMYERRDHLSFEVKTFVSRKEQSPYVRFQDAEGRTATHYWLGAVEATVRWAPGEKFYESRRHRLPINLDNLELFLTHRSGFTRTWRQTRPLNTTELGVRKRLWLSAFGYVDLLAKGGHIWNTVPYPEIAMPSANLSYVIQPETFALVDPMEFVADTYGQIDFYYRANGALLNRIPLLNRLRLREVIGVKGWWGHLSQQNRPDLHDDLFRFPEAATQTRMPRPYMEASAGLENILNIFRVDYVWRLTYRRDAPCLHGIRIAARLKF
ncbi:MAG: carboxypeptidase-like regulatory domain-containing protein [Muribaculaceae bacterium]|nr:carboxypeptidase-like regulatory domain-containing protein [Muribaculaceae bacterium]